MTIVFQIIVLAALLIRMSSVAVKDFKRQAPAEKQAANLIVLLTGLASLYGAGALSEIVKF